MSDRTFLRRFAEATGMAPGEWLVAERIEAARSLLESSDLSVEQIAGQAGFGTVDTMRHHFRRRLGSSPSGYRERFSRGAMTD